MDIYKFYDQTHSECVADKEAKEKAAAISRAKKIKELRLNIEKLLKNSVHELYTWTIQLTENLPQEAYDFMKRIINSEVLKGCDESDLKIEIDHNMIKCTTSYDCYCFETEKEFSSLDYTEFKKETHCTLAITLYPSMPNLVLLEIFDNDDFFDKRYKMEKEILSSIVEKLYGKEHVTFDGTLWTVNINFNDTTNSE